MTKVSYSTVFEQSADQVWAVIRDFNSYPVWVATVTESHIEEGKSGDAVGAIRNFVEFGARIRQRLVAHSDLERFYTYESCEPLGTITYYQGTGRVTPIAMEIGRSSNGQWPSNALKKRRRTVRSCFKRQCRNG
jgi:hypothetical protein